MAPNARETSDAAERRRQLIHESKYLGGDMDHTHLVKGLDFALLQKVRSEIESREEWESEEEEEEKEEKEKDKENKEEDKEQDEGMRNRKARRKEAREAKSRFGSEATEKEEKRAAKKVEVEVEDEDEEKQEEVACRTLVGKNIMRTIFKPEIPKVNELFLPGRMAYVMDLDEEVETDIPTTSIRSKKDVINNEQKATLSTNDIVINKLTQILSYLRAGTRSKKKKKHDLLAPESRDGLNVEIKEEPGLRKVVDAGISIYDDEELVKPKREEKRERREKERGREGERKREKDGRDREGRDRERKEDRRGREERRGGEREERGREYPVQRERTEYTAPKEREDKRDRPGREEMGREEEEDREEGSSKKPVSYFDKPVEKEAERRGGFSTEDRQMIKALMKKEEEQVLSFVLYLVKHSHVPGQAEGRQEAGWSHETVRQRGVRLAVILY